MSYRIQYIFLILGALVAVTACVSRNRIGLYMAIEGESGKVKIESTQYIASARLGNPYSDRKTLSGETAIILVHTSIRGATLPHSPLTKALQFDEYLRSDVYFEIPQPPMAADLSLVGRSFVHILERFDQPIEEKIFLPDDTGRLVIDSVTSRRLYVTINSTYANRLGQTLSVTGSVRIELPKD